MNNELYVKIVVLIFSILGTLITAYVVPALRAKMTDAEVEQLSWFITCLVRAAEQIYRSDEWKEKKAYVMAKAIQYLKNLHIDLTLEDLDAIVEGIVNEVKHS